MTLPLAIMETSWEDRAAAKRANIIAKIPAAWRLSLHDLERARDQRDLTGAFINQFLTEEDIFIISKDSVELAKCIEHGDLTAVDVTTAFCKTAAIAHQIVRYHVFFFSSVQKRKT